MISKFIAITKFSLFESNPAQCTPLLESLFESLSEKKASDLLFSLCLRWLSSLDYSAVSYSSIKKISSLISSNGYM